MIELPRIYTTSVTSPSQPSKTIRFQAIADEEKPVTAVERRRKPSRRKPASEKEQIERRVSADRRRSMFNDKA
ncbi:MAG: hypothetical protein OEY48_03570 [Gammaproteobacteria bacterium]|nr:hypothetical protein [Gammaproteobacteria bacterium]MDH5591906.1 hypothetical protein [Gammaproteobacteria bacterium]